jgi:cell division protein FtsB
MSGLYKQLALIILIFELIFAGYFTYRIYVTLSRREKIVYLKNIRDDIRTKYELATERISYVRSDEYIEEYLRNSLGYARENERVFIIADTVKLPEITLSDPKLEQRKVEPTTVNKAWSRIRSWWGLYFGK